MSQAQIGNLQVALGINTAQFAAGLSQAQGSLTKFGQGLKAFATGAAAMGIFNQSITALKGVADMGDVAESIGITAEQLQVFNRLALASGTSTDVMTRGLQSIAEQSVDANSALSKLFTANDLTMAGKNINQIILDFMTLLQNAKSPAEQLAIATDVLGTKVGRNLVEAMRTGSQGWQEEQEKMRQSGNYLADESVKDAQRIETAYNSAIANIQTAWQGMVVKMLQGAQNLADALDPILNPDTSKGTAFGELWKLVSGQKVNWGYGSSPGFGGKLIQPPSVNMGPMGGAGQFPPIVAKVTIRQPTKEETEEVKKAIEDAVTPSPVPPDTIESIYGAGEAFDAMWKHMESGIPEAQNLNNVFLDMAETISDSLGYALQGLISGTMSLKEAFASMAQGVSQQLSQLAAQLIKSSIMKVIQMMLGMGGGAGFNVGGMTFGGLFANGGNLGSGKWGIAGENGPEIIHGPASITPMGKAAAPAPQMNVTVINNSSASVSTRKGANGGLEVMVEEMIADKLLRGGNKIDSALARGYGLRRAGR